MFGERCTLSSCQLSLVRVSSRPHFTMVVRLPIILLILLHLVKVVSLQRCPGVMKRGSDPDDPPFNDDNNDGLPASPAVQAIIPTYKFYCNCVNITSWETYVQPGGKNHYMARVYDITFQVWRPSPTVTSSNGYEGCYSLVGENIFTSISFSDGGFVQLSPTPPSNSIITAQSGDVVGYYTNSRDGDNQGIQLERDRDYNENIVWYKMERDSLRTNNTLSVGSGGTLTVSTRAAPMLKVSKLTVHCPTVVPTTSSKSKYISPTNSPISYIFEASSSNSYYYSAQSALSTKAEFFTEYTSTSIDNKIYISNVRMSSYVMASSNVVKSSDTYYEYSAITDFQNTTGSSHNSEVSDNTHNLIIVISVSGFVMIAILVILSMCFILIRTKRNTLQSKDTMASSNLSTIPMEPNVAYGSAKAVSNVDSLDSTVIIKANSAYSHNHGYRNPIAEITPVDCKAYNNIENHDEGNHNEKSTSTNDEAEYFYIRI